MTHPRILRGALALAFFALVSGEAMPQGIIQTQPLPATTANGNASSTIAVTNTFQKIWSAGAIAGSAQGGAHGAAVRSRITERTACI